MNVGALILVLVARVFAIYKGDTVYCILSISKINNATCTAIFATHQMLRRKVAVLGESLYLGEEQVW